MVNKSKIKGSGREYQISWRKHNETANVEN